MGLDEDYEQVKKEIARQQAIRKENKAERIYDPMLYDVGARRARDARETVQHIQKERDTGIVFDHDTGKQHLYVDGTYKGTFEPGAHTEHVWRALQEEWEDEHPKR